MPGDQRERARELAEAISEALNYTHAISRDPAVVKDHLEELEAALVTIIELLGEHGADVEANLDLRGIGARARSFLNIAKVRPMASAALREAALEFLSDFGIEGVHASQPHGSHVDPVDVDAVFEEFNAGLADAGPPTTETHYDLGVAYAEMGLMRDAVAELELAAEAGHEGARSKLRELSRDPPDEPA